MTAAARRPGPTSRSRVDVWSAAVSRRRDDRVITEEPLEIRLEWPGVAAHRIAVTMRTPGSDFELACGYLLGEGIAGAPGHIATVAYCTDTALTPEQAYNVVTVTLTGPPRHEPARRQTTMSSACGVCGKDSLAAVVEFGGRPLRSDATVAASAIRRLPDLLRSHQRLFDRTGGVHAAGLFTLAGEPTRVREDVGRHNAVDKVIGAAALGDSPALADPADLILGTSARAGFEIVQKAVMARIPVVAAVGAASSMAVDCADEFGLTLVGFVRGQRFVVYAGGDRLLAP